LFDRTTKKLTFQYRQRPNIPVKDLAEMKPIRYKSSDGLEIPAFLILSKGLEPKNLPVIVFPHGGPWARDEWGYNSSAQFLAKHLGGRYQESMKPVVAKRLGEITVDVETIKLVPTKKK
jgi:acetyl esterase/lipase